LKAKTFKDKTILTRSFEIKLQHITLTILHNSMAHECRIMRTHSICTPSCSDVETLVTET